MGNRHKGRIFALQLLYALDFNDSPQDQTIKLFWEGIHVTGEVKEFADLLVAGMLSQQEKIDGILEKYSENWSLDRMAGVDRNILRFAVYEIMHMPDIPPNVTINEAVEIGKKFGTEDSGAFINGILDRIAKDFQEKIS